MKKILFFIGILAVLSSTLIPELYVSAQNAVCKAPDGTLLTNTEADCKSPNAWTPVQAPGTVILQNPGNPQVPNKNCAPPSEVINGECTTPYTLLAPINTADNQGTGKTFNPAQDNAFGAYLNMMIKIFIGICAVFAVVMIVMGGIEYMTSELISSKEAGKERITNALFGLLVALGSYALLNTINPDLLKSDLYIESTTITASDKDIIVIHNGTRSAGDGSSINPSSVGTTCDAQSIASAAQSAGSAITDGQAATFACLISKESGCKSLTNYNWGGGSSAYGPYQILLQTHSDCFENQACYTAAGVAGPINCSTGFRGGNPIPGSAVTQQCITAANNFTCSTGAAMCVLKKQGFSAWTADPRNTKQKECIAKYNY